MEYKPLKFPCFDHIGCYHGKQQKFRPNPKLKLMDQVIFRRCATITMHKKQNRHIVIGLFATLNFMEPKSIQDLWEKEIGGVSGYATVEYTYAGPDLEDGMYYQFRVLSFREKKGDRTYISATEDLRGVFYFDPEGTM